MAAAGAHIAAGVNYPNLKGLSLLQLTDELRDTDKAITWAMNNGLLAGTRQCGRCQGNVAMKLENCMEGDGKRWRCPNRGCRSTMSIRNGSFYTISKLNLRDSIMVKK